MTWTAYQFTGGAAESPPLLGPDGNIWASAQQTGTLEWINVCTTGGSVTSASVAASTETPGGTTNPVSDGTSVYVCWGTGYPRTRVTKWTPGTLASTTSSPSGGLIAIASALAINPSFLFVTGEGNPHSLEITQWNYPTVAQYNRANFSPTFASLGGMAVLGATIWSPQAASTSIWAINASTLAGSSFTMPGTANSTCQQIAYDGTYIYIGTSGGGVVVWNPATNSGTLVGSTVITVCYYSANLNLIVLSDAVGNIYTMPLGGGTLTNIGNLGTIVGGGTSPLCYGFCDGPSGTLWATGIATSGSILSYFFKYTSAPVVTAQLVMLA